MSSPQGAYESETEELEKYRSASAIPFFTEEYGDLNGVFKGIANSAHCVGGCRKWS